MNVIPWTVLLVMNTFPLYSLQDQTRSSVLEQDLHIIQAGYLNIALTDKPIEVRETVPMLNHIQMLFPVNWDLKLSELLGACLSNVERWLGSFCLTT